MSQRAYQRQKSNKVGNSRRIVHTTNSADVQTMKVMQAGRMQSLPSCIRSTCPLESLIKTDDGSGPGAMGAMGHTAC
jgi:hypothetical protein